MSHRVTLSEHALEGATYLIHTTFLDQDDAPIVPDALTLTLYERATRTIVNSRDHVSVLNENGGSFAGTDFTLTLSGDDNALVGAGNGETHIALLEWTWDGTKTGKAEIAFRVVNLVHVPAV